MESERTANQNVPTGSPEPSERRAAPRLSSTLRVHCYPVGRGLLERRAARVRNVSRTGIGLVLDRCWQAGTAIIVELPVPEEEGVRSARGRVVHATSQPGGTFLMGCTFDAPLTEAEVQILAR